MNLAKRARDVEDRGLSPREAVILWMREAHAFDSRLDYARWLMDEPDDSYPLIRMPRQVVAAVRAEHKGIPDAQLRPRLYRVQKDLLFLYHLQSEMNEHVLESEEPFRLRLRLLGEKLRGLVYQIHSVDGDRLKCFELPENLTRPGRKRKKTQEEKALEKHILSWPGEEALLWAEVTSVKEAERLIAARYLDGEPLFFPQAERALDEMLALLDGLFEVYESVLDGRPPETDVDFARWIAGERPRTKLRSKKQGETELRVRFDVSRAARCLAERFIVRARAEALQQLGEGNAAAELIRDWMRADDETRLGSATR